LSAIALAKAGACTHHFSNAWTPAIPIDLLFSDIGKYGTSFSRHWNSAMPVDLLFSTPWKINGVKAPAFFQGLEKRSK
jgi:hypothetical protein